MRWECGVWTVEFLKILLTKLLKNVCHVESYVSSILLCKQTKGIFKKYMITMFYILKTLGYVIEKIYYSESWDLYKNRKWDVFSYNCVIHVSTSVNFICMKVFIKKKKKIISYVQKYFFFKFYQHF